MKASVPKRQSNKPITIYNNLKTLTADENLMKTFSRLKSSIALLVVAGQLQAQDANTDITYNGEAGRIINENCVVCHRDGGIGPMQFETYDQVRPWAPLISYKVANKEMPPYAYDEGIGIQNLIGDWRLEQQEIEQIVAWVCLLYTSPSPRDS